MSFLFVPLSQENLGKERVWGGGWGGGGVIDHWYFVVLVENVFGKRFNFLLRCSPLQEWYTLNEKKEEEKKGPKNWKTWREQVGKIERKCNRIFT